MVLSPRMAVLLAVVALPGEYVEAALSVRGRIVRAVDLAKWRRTRCGT